MASKVAKLEVLFDILCLDGVNNRKEIVDFFEFPHYGNDFKPDYKTTHSFKWVKGIGSNKKEAFCVLWANRPEPTLDEIKALYIEEFGDED